MDKAKQKSLTINVQILFGINYGKDYNTRQLNKFIKNSIYRIEIKVFIHIWCGNVKQFR